MLAKGVTKMSKILVKRLLSMMLQLFILGFVLFFLMTDRTAGDRWVQVGDNLVQVSYGNQNIFIGYLQWWENVFHGNFGYTWYQGLQLLPTMEALARRLPHTLRLLSLALLIVYGIGIPLGIISGRRPGSFIDRFIQMTTQISASFPSFTMAYILLITFAFTLRWLPHTGTISIEAVLREVSGFAYQVERWRHVVLPAFSLAIVQIIIPMKYLRGGIVEISKKQFVTTAKAKGVTERNVFKKHVFASSLLPIIATFPLQLSAMISGSIIIELIFNFQGIGGLFLGAFLGGNTHVAMILALMLGAVIMLLNLIADILIMKLDPRVEFEKN